MRVAAIDIGTNSVLLLVAERTATGALIPVEERATITRLGEGVDRTRRLAPEAIDRTKACLEEYAAIVRRLQVPRVVAVATSAMRDAAGGEAIREHVRKLLGVELRVISGDEEARLTFAGALSGLGVAAESGDVVVFDVGGGSTEVVHGRIDRHGAHVLFAKSFDVGSVRLTERCSPSDPPTVAERNAIERSAKEAFAALPPLSASDDPVGIAGTVTTLAAVSLGLSPYDGTKVHGYVLSMTELRRVADDLARLPLDLRRQLPGLDPKRADVIVAGALIVIAVLEELGAERMRVSDRGVRWGLAHALAEGPASQGHPQ